MADDPEVERVGHPLLTEAALLARANRAEIDRLHAEVDRLRAERDALLGALRRLCHPNRHGRWKHTLEYFLDFATEDEAMSHLRMVLGVDSPTSSSPPSASGPS